RLGVGRLDAEQDEPGAGDASGIGRRRQGYAPIEINALELQSVTRNRICQRAPPDQLDAGAGAGQHRAEIAADRTGAHHGDILKRKSRHRYSVARHSPRLLTCTNAVAEPVIRERSWTALIPLR